MYMYLAAILAPDPEPGTAEAPARAGLPTKMADTRYLNQPAEPWGVDYAAVLMIDDVCRTSIPEPGWRIRDAMKHTHTHK